MSEKMLDDLQEDDDFDEERIEVSLRPYDAISIMAFLEQFSPDLEGHPQLAALRESVQNYKDAVCDRITQEHLDDAKRQNEINAMTGKGPNENMRGENII